MPQEPDSTRVPRSPRGPDVTVRIRPEGAPQTLRAPGPDSSRPALMVDERYRIEAELGRGAMGVVYRATEVWLERPVALKLIAPSLVGDVSVAMRFHREAKALASIRSLHVVQLYAFGHHDGSYFFAMEYVRGRSLKEILVEHRQHGDTVPVHRALTILAQIADGISAVHAAGIVHRDVKPSNIIIEEDTGRPVLVDFGLAAHGDDAVVAMAMGTPLYMAPEQTAMTGTKLPITPRTDVYSLGCTAFEMLSGHPPFPGGDAMALMRMHATMPAPLISSMRKDCAVFDRVLARALAKDPAERYGSCLDLTNDLAAAGTRWRTGHLTSRPPPLPFEKDAPLRVLIVDGDPVFAKFATQAVHAAFFGYLNARVEISTARSGDDAIERAELQPPDMVLLDYDMPGLDGPDTLSQLRALPGCARARIVVLSRRIQEEDRWRFSVLGVRDFISKTTIFPTLVRSLQRVAERMVSGAPSSKRMPPE